MYLALIILPLLGSIASGFFGRKVGISGSHFIACSCVILTTIFSFIAFFEVGFNNIPVTVHLFKWVDSESLNVLWGFNFDSLTVSMLIPVLVVSSLVHIYSIEYMSHDPHNQRFFSYLSLFTFMMIILVTANNFLLMFVGWEGVGVCSYLLVSFWFTRIAANQSSLAAFLTNRVGDCLLTVGMFTLLWSFGNIDYSTVFSIAPFINENIITLVGICLLIGAMAKSSQVGLHIWLPMAMEGPTPVSALIHAATMVTAGVYLLMRTSPLLEYSSTVLISCLWLGAITTVFSSLIGLFQQDIKKVIAYSTMSQLGMMVIAIGLSSYNVALFHLVNHAFYKALLFLGAGAVIHAVSDNQDFRKYGGLKQLLPLTYSVMLIASLSLVAFPFMTGFYSKDLILESAYGQFTLSGIAVYFIASIGAIFTTLYSVKVLYLTFLSNPIGPINNYKNAHEGKQFMSIPLIILAIFSIFFGYITKDIFIGLGSNFFVDNSIFIHPSNEIMLDTEFAVPTFYKLLPLFFTISLGIISLLVSEFFPRLLLLFKFSNTGYNIFGFFNQRFLIELLYNNYITNTIFKLGGQTTKVLDKGSVELVGPHGLEKVLLAISSILIKFDTGLVTTYALYILVGFLFFNIMVYIELPLLNSSYLCFILIIITAIKYNSTDKLDLKNLGLMQAPQAPNPSFFSLLSSIILLIYPLLLSIISIYYGTGGITLHAQDSDGDPSGSPSGSPSVAPSVAPSIDSNASGVNEPWFLRASQEDEENRDPYNKRSNNLTLLENVIQGNDAHDIILDINHQIRMFRSSEQSLFSAFNRNDLPEILVCQDLMTHRHKSYLYITLHADATPIQRTFEERNHSPFGLRGYELVGYYPNPSQYGPWRPEFCRFSNFDDRGQYSKFHELNMNFPGEGTNPIFGNIKQGSTDYLLNQPILSIMSEMRSELDAEYGPVNSNTQVRRSRLSTGYTPVLSNISDLRRISTSHTPVLLGYNYIGNLGSPLCYIRINKFNSPILNSIQDLPSRLTGSNSPVLGVTGNSSPILNSIQDLPRTLSGSNSSNSIRSLGTNSTSAHIRDITPKPTQLFSGSPTELGLEEGFVRCNVAVDPIALNTALEKLKFNNHVKTQRVSGWIMRNE